MRPRLLLAVGPKKLALIYIDPTQIGLVIVPHGISCGMTLSDLCGSYPTKATIRAACS
jgi:hypothetical protein